MLAVMLSLFALSPAPTRETSSADNALRPRRLGVDEATATLERRAGECSGCQVIPGCPRKSSSGKACDGCKYVRDCRESNGIRHVCEPGTMYGGEAGPFGSDGDCCCRPKAVSNAAPKAAASKRASPTLGITPQTQNTQPAHTTTTGTTDTNSNKNGGTKKGG